MPASETSVSAWVLRFGAAVGAAVGPGVGAPVGIAVGIAVDAGGVVSGVGVGGPYYVLHSFCFGCFAFLGNFFFLISFCDFFLGDGDRLVCLRRRALYNGVGVVVVACGGASERSVHCCGDINGVAAVSQLDLSTPLNKSILVKSPSRLRASWPI